ncbi:hypothetical protein [Maribacter sp. 2307UL18-2]|uniref:hypothetical protein n=1 Tax=Maribacter sp. 2307UL18-2 TaxID=3386274 RepID=UPI0039BD3B7F
MKFITGFFSLTLFLLGPFSVQAQERALKTALIGGHTFGVQFIWDGYGEAIITEDEHGVLHLSGTQYSKDKEEYVLLEGTITIIDALHFRVKGNLKLFTEGCCGLLDREITGTFCKTGNRKYWRLKERDELCDSYTCTYYMDIFE